jgi:hypothetical protein
MCMHPKRLECEPVSPTNRYSDSRNSLGEESGIDCHYAVRHEAYCLTTVLRRLLWVASFRNADCYRHPLIAAACGEQQTSRELREFHQELFLQWLCLTLREQSAQLNEYLPAEENPRRGMIQAWIRSSIVDLLVPPDASEPDQRLFQLDFGNCLALAYASLEREQPKRLPFYSTTQIRLAGTDNPILRRLKAIVRIHRGLVAETEPPGKISRP